MPLAVADICPFAVNRNGFADDGVGNRFWDQFFGMLKRAVVVGAASDNGWHNVSDVPRVNQLVSGRFGCGVWRARIISAGFRETAVLCRPENFVGGNVNEAKFVRNV